MAFLLYFLTLISTITLRWQQRETAVMVSRGLRAWQLLAVGLIETTIIGRPWLSRWACWPASSWPN